MSDVREAHGAVPAALHEAERALALLLAVAHGVRSWSPLGQGLPRLLGDVATPLGQAAAALWVPERNVLVTRGVWSARSADGAALEQLMQRLRLAPGNGLPGTAWSGRVPVAAASGPQDEDRATAGVRGELLPTLGLPALNGEEVVGVVELYSTSHAELSERLMHVLEAVSHQLGAFLDRHRGALGLSPLTAREVQVLALAGRGLPVSAIAQQLRISRGTVKSHLEHIYAKLGAGNRTAAVAHALRAGLIE
jgi:DNA-binding CsgD family transcriptional regulator